MVSAPACCTIQTKIDFNSFDFNTIVKLDYFDQKILGILSRKHNPVTLNELVSACGFARSTVLIQSRAPWLRTACF